MRHTYCCNAKVYEQYYLNQVGHGVTPFYSGVQYQQGYRFGDIFSSISKTIMPLVKKGAKAIGKQALKSGVGFASDVLAGKNAFLLNTAKNTRDPIAIRVRVRAAYLSLVSYSYNELGGKIKGTRDPFA